MSDRSLINYVRELGDKPFDEMIAIDIADAALELANTFEIVLDRQDRYREVLPWLYANITTAALGSPKLINVLSLLKEGEELD